MELLIRAIPFRFFLCKLIRPPLSALQHRPQNYDELGRSHGNVTQTRAAFVVVSFAVGVDVAVVVVAAVAVALVVVFLVGCCCCGCGV
jgi:hypothetical protein